MKKFKNGIIWVAAICLLVVSFAFPTLAEDEALNTCTDPEASDIESRYNLSLSSEGNGQYRITMNGNAEDLGDAKFAVTGIAEYDNGESKIIAGRLDQDVSTIPQITKDQDAIFKATPANTDDGLILSIAVKLVAGTDTQENCDYVGALTVKSYGDSHRGNIFGDESNNVDNVDSVYHPGSICYNFHNGIWDSSQFIGIKQSDFESYNYQAVGGLSILGRPARDVYKDVLAYCYSDKISKAASYSKEELANMIGNLITYAKVQTKTIGNTNQTFDQLFTDIKNKALATSNDKSGKDAKVQGLKCNWDSTKEEIAEDYYVNKDYFYKKEVVESIDVQYTYHYAPGNTVTTPSQNVCDRVCEEAVKVEYGPPVASKAGLCFEYKVKVTSYAKCSADVKLQPPPMPTAYCSPVPFCHEANYRWQGHQAGPTEDFDRCIKECDGGKYTSRCSIKCYKKVYPNSKIKLAVDYSSKIERLSLESELDECIKSSPDGGCYYYSGDEIRWKSTYQNGLEWSTDVRALGRWYREVGWDVSDFVDYGVGGVFGRYDSSSNGIKTKIKRTSTNHCQDICYWISDSCRRDEYLNPQSILSDYQANKKEYESAVTKCKAAATCSSSTAEFTISTKYDTKDENGRIKNNTIIFPYNSGKDKISSKGEQSASINTSTSSNSTILSYNGCYKEQDEKNWYQTEWSFPGTYIHNKTGEISFAVPSDSSGWYYENKKFCMPLNAESVNKKWWEWKQIGNSCYSKQEIEAELAGTPGTSNGYNISAQTKNFGYFDWDISINCFYALRNESCIVDNTGCCPPESTNPPLKTNGIENYTIRTIDRANMFPNAKVEGVVDSTKRDIGFNWTSKARILETKNKDYAVDPIKLIQDIQNGSATLYEDSNLDYQFYLTPTTLRTIRQYNKKYDYDDWNGVTQEKNGIIVYSSNLFRNTGIESNVIGGDSDAIKKLGTIGVNNE